MEYYIIMLGSVLAWCAIMGYFALKMLGYIKVKNITERVRVEVQRRMENNIDEEKWNEGVMFVLDIIESEI